MIRIIDGNNWLYVKLEASLTGKIARELYMETISYPSSETVIWAFDAPDGSSARRKIYPDYKANREGSGEDIRAGLKMLKDVLLYSNAVVIEVPGFEGDDVIAEVVKRYQDRDKILIMSTDGDLQQLTIHPNVSQTRAPYKDMKTSEVRLYKTLVGDPSDNIKGIVGFGKAAWANCNREALQNMFDGKFEKLFPSLEAMCEALGMKPKQAQWMLDNPQKLMDMWEITGFMEITDLPKYMVGGTLNMKAADDLLQEFMQ